MDDFGNHADPCQWLCGKRSSKCPPEHLMTIKMTSRCPGFQPLSHYSFKFQQELNEKYKLTVKKDEI